MHRVGWEFPLVLGLGAIAVWSIGPVVAAIPALYLAAVAPELVRIDLGRHRLPNHLVVPGIGIGLIAASGSWLTTGIAPVVSLTAGLGYGGLLLLFGLAEGMGMGDVKLAAAIGLASPTAVLAFGAPLLAFLVGGVVAVVVLIRRGRGARMAFGPYLLIGYFAAAALAGIAPAL